jgi:DNA-binding transcriptional ArsR family regulator
LIDDLPELPEIPEEAFITDPSQFESLSSPTRIRILKVCIDPSSVRQIADRLGVPPTRLYYHVNLLEDAGFLQVVHTRKSGARIEKLYRVAGKSITPGPELIHNVDDIEAAAKALASIVIEPARVETEHVLAKRLEGEEQSWDLARTFAYLTPDEFEEIASKLRAIVTEHMAGKLDPNNPESSEYSLTYALLPLEPKEL